MRRSVTLVAVLLSLAGLVNAGDWRNGESSRMAKRDPATLSYNYVPAPTLQRHQLPRSFDWCDKGERRGMCMYLSFCRAETLSLIRGTVSTCCVVPCLQFRHAAAGSSASCCHMRCCRWSGPVHGKLEPAHPAVLRQLLGPRYARSHPGPPEDQEEGCAAAFKCPTCTSRITETPN